MVAMSMSRVAQVSVRLFENYRLAIACLLRNCISNGNVLICVYAIRYSVCNVPHSMEVTYHVSPAVARLREVACLRRYAEYRISRSINSFSVPNVSA